MFRFFVGFLGYMFSLGSIMGLVAAAGVGVYIAQLSDDLPSVNVLRNYEPPVMTRIHAADGSLVAEYARERRLFLPIQAIPSVVRDAFLSAEDSGFYDHKGVDPQAIIRAAVTNFQSRGSRLQGASTITQQVAKNFLLTNEQSYERKVKEAILSLRIETAFTKDEILERYLNEIYLGLGAYGVAAAALVYFDKSVHELTVAEAAYLAALPKAPNNYHPFRQPEAAIARRNWVLERMMVDGAITDAERRAAIAEPLKVKPRARSQFLFASDYFAEEVRRELIDLYGEESLYGGGLSVRTSLDPEMQAMARQSLMEGLMKIDVQRGGYRGPIETFELDPSSDWGPVVGQVDPLSDVPEWDVAIVLSVSGNQAEVGLHPGRDVWGKLNPERARGIITMNDIAWRRGRRDGRGDVGFNRFSRVSDQLRVGDAIYVERVEGSADRYNLRQIPEISGAILVMDPHTGRVLALQGGFSYADSEFNRATQALRQPGSSFKPFVYAAALDNGYTPSSIVLDAPIEIRAGNEIWRPKNYGGKFAGPSTLRTGIERSRNVMTVRLAKDMGMPLVAEYAERFGIYDDLGKYLPMALGAGETTVKRLVGAYSIVANGGQRIQPTLIDRIQDRHGRTVFRHDKRRCDSCNSYNWSGQPSPIVIDDREYVLDPMTAYQITSIMEGVVQRGTATRVKALGRPVAGKTGTTNEEKDAWFVGFTPDLVAGVFVGYDDPRPMGRGATGGQMAAPIFLDFMQKALKDKPPVEFRVPEGIKLIPVNRVTGRPSSGAGTILEAFKPGTAPGDTFSIIGLNDNQPSRRVTRESERAVLSGTGGLY